MLKALRYLKPFWLSVIAIIALIFGQVQLELALPDYMSNIVTYGIQYGGITESSPTILSQETYDHMQYFLDAESLEVFNDQYTKQNSFTINDQTYTDYEVYVKTGDIDESIQQNIDTAFLITSMLQRDEVLSQIGFDSSEVLWSMIESDPTFKSQISSAINTQMESYTEDNLAQAQILMIKNEYEHLGIDTEAIQTNYILHEGAVMLGIALLGSICALIAAYLAAKTATGAARNMRDDVFKKVESFSSAEFSKFSTASLITRTTNDIQQVQQVLTMLLRIVLFAPLMGLTSLFKVLRYPELAGILGWTIVIIIVLMVVVFAIALPKFKISQKLVDRLNLVTREQLEGMLVIRAFTNEKLEEQRFDTANTDITKLNIFLNRLMSIIQPIMTFLMSSVTIVIIWIGANSIDLGTMQIGDMMAFIQYASHVLISFMIVAAIFIMIPRSSVSAKRIFEVLETTPSIQDPQNPSTLVTDGKDIVFDHVSFRYPHAEQDVLQDISFTAKPGETIAFIGSTGSGKSTLINLLPRFYDVSDGSIKIGDTDIRDVSTKDLRDAIGYIPQKGILFSGTIESNLRYADENASDETINQALEVSQAKEFVERMEDQLQTPISQGGTNVSGGQKQRLSIARALTKNANIFIFDDTFSALDYATDAKLRQALNEMMKEKNITVFIVAQRISTIKNADQIVVLDEGKIAGIGTHEQLLDSCSVYQEIAHSQLSEEELSK